MSRTCPQCGAEALTDDARHCHQCGAPLDPGSEPAPVGEDVGSHVEGAALTAAPSKESRNWALLAHLSAFVAAWVALAFLGPLVVWLVKRHEDAFVEAHAREALNFNITVLILVAIGIPLAFLIIGIPLLIAIGIAWIVLTIRAAITASNGDLYRYPMTIRFVS
ncbi:MAG: DUF4870 domain-containing protein [Nitriliruptorales bacterium]